MIAVGLSRRDRQLLERAARDLAAFRLLVDRMPAAFAAAEEYAPGPRARRYDGPMVRSVGTTGDPTATAALRRDPVRDALAEVIRNIDVMHRAAVAAAAAVEALGGFDSERQAGTRMESFGTPSLD